MPLLLLAGLLDREAHAQARAQHGLGLEHVLELAARKSGLSKYAASGQKRTVVPVLLLPTSPTTSSFEWTFAVLERDVVFLAAAAHPALEVLRKRVHDRHADAVQAAGELVA